MVFKIIRRLQLRLWARAFCRVVLVSTLLFLGASPVGADAIAAGNTTPLPDQPARLFEVHCVGCHSNGGNIIRRGKNLKAKALERYGYDDVASITDIITHGKGVMSAYRDRLTREEIQALAAYVLEQAEAGW